MIEDILLQGSYDANQDYTLRCYRLSGERRNDVVFEVNQLQLVYEANDTCNSRLSLQLPAESRKGLGHRRSNSQSFEKAGLSNTRTDHLQIVEMNGVSIPCYISLPNCHFSKPI